jgi:hypothetical protein
MAVVGKVAQVNYLNFDQPRFASAPDNAVLQRTAKKFRKNGYDLKLHAESFKFRVSSFTPALLVEA